MSDIGIGKLIEAERKAVNGEAATLMRERNDLDRRKCELLERLANK